MDVIIQARVNSRRRPRKTVDAIIGNYSILDILVGWISEKHRVIIATPNKEIQDNYMGIPGIYIHLGDNSDVSKRIIKAAERYNVNKFIRVCADNPFLNPYLLDILVNQFSKTDCDYMGYKLFGKPAIQCKLGIFAEGLTLEALKRAYAIKRSQHVTDTIYNNPRKFKIAWIDRLTVDTEKDFENAKKLNHDLYSSRDRAEP